jgi:serine kinase of HPr protein (carbohydrate metabolism regulator)
MISIYVTHYNKLEFLSLQYENIKKYCKDKFNYIVINNGIDDNTSLKISKLSKELNIQVITINDNSITVDNKKQIHLKWYRRSIYHHHRE